MVAVSHTPVTYNASVSPAEEGSQSGGGSQSGAFDFQSHFPSTGSHDDAVMDIRNGTGRWYFTSHKGSTPWTGTHPNLSVEAAAGHGLTFPTTNVLVSRSVGSLDGGLGELSGALPQLSVGSTLAWRGYDNLVVPHISGDPVTHPFQDGADNWMYQVRSFSATTYLTQFYFDGQPLNASLFNGPTLNKNHFYRIEFLLTRLHESYFSFYPYIYDESGATVATPSSFSTVASGANLSSLTLSYGSFSHTTYMKCGNNGQGGTWPEAPFINRFLGAFAANIQTTRIGPYVQGEDQ